MFERKSIYILCSLERKYVLESVQYVNCTTLLADQKLVFALNSGFEETPLLNTKLCNQVPSLSLSR